MQFSKSLAAIGATAALALSGCVTDPTTGQQHMSKTAMYGLGAAATCGIVGALTHGVASVDIGLDIDIAAPVEVESPTSPLAPGI